MRFHDYCDGRAKVSKASLVRGRDDNGVTFPPEYRRRVRDTRWIYDCFTTSLMESKSTPTGSHCLLNFTRNCRVSTHPDSGYFEFGITWKYSTGIVSSVSPHEEYYRAKTSSTQISRITRRRKVGGHDVRCMCECKKQEPSGANAKKNIVKNYAISWERDGTCTCTHRIHRRPFSPSFLSRERN